VKRKNMEPSLDHGNVKEQLRSLFIVELNVTTKEIKHRVLYDADRASRYNFW